MTSTQIRQSYLDFFKARGHTVVPSSSLIPDAPNLEFTNSGMNQFVPIFLGQTEFPHSPARATDTQKCIRAGGKHNDLDDVGFDTYHHTFFEMLGNWSFGDYFKAEAIQWAWELVAKEWKFPVSRLFATVYKPGPGDPATFDQEAYDLWAKIFTDAGLDPSIHIVYGNRKDNFWMMGDTGPCGPCSELNVDLTPGDPELSVERQRAGALLVNSGDARCIEIWNLVFIQFNADGQGGYTNLPARHVDTGMGFERVTSIIQGTKNFTDFTNLRVSNYETDVFRPLFTALEQMTGLKYGSTLPAPGQIEKSRQETVDICFRVLADHIRALSFSIADGIIPSNTKAGYTLRRILRRAVMYGSKLGFNKPFFAQMVGPLVQEMGDAFPELKAKQALIESTITKEEELFHKTLSRGTELFRTTFEEVRSKQKTEGQTQNIFPGDIAFQLSDTYGFPYDLTELMAREQNWTVDKARFDELLAEQRKRSQEGRDIEVIRVVTTSDSDKLIRPTHFTGYDELQTASIIISCENATLITTETPFYAELGGQVGDTGYVEIEGKQVDVINTVKAEGQNGIFVHKLREPIPAQTGDRVTLYVDEKRRSRIEAHHTVTHILHWALREVLGHSVVQKGSYVGPDRLRFDFAYGSAMTSEQLEKVHALIYEKIGLDDRAERPFGDSVDSEEMLYAEVKGDPSILQLFGDKYGEKVRVVSIGDYSRELCGGTHLQWTGHAGYFRVLSESSISAGIRRIEAASGLALIDEVESQYGKLKEQHQQLLRKATENGLGECVEKMKLPELPSTSHSLENGIPIPDVERVGSWDAGWQGAKAHWQALVEAERVHKLTAETLTQAAKEQAKKQESDWQSRATAQVNEWLARDVVTTIGSTPFFAEQVVGATAAYLPVLADALKARWEGVAILAATEGEKVTLVALSTPNFAKKHHAGKIMQAIAPLVGGKGGGRPDFAQGGGNQPAGVGAAFAEAEARLRG